MNETTALDTRFPVGDMAPVEMFDGVTGLENIDQDCIALPFLKLAQDTTEQAKRGSSNKIEGLLPGMFFSPSSKRIYGEKVRLVILKFYRTFGVFESKEPNSKYLGTITASEFKNTVENADGSYREKSYTLDVNGHRYVDQRNFVVLPYDHPEDGVMILTMSSSNIKASRNILTMANSLKTRRPDGKLVTSPIWSSVWELSTAFREDPPYSYHVINTVDRLGWVPKNSAPFLKELFESMQEAKIETTMDDPAETSAPAPVPTPVPAEAPRVAPVPAHGATMQPDIF